LGLFFMLKNRVRIPAAGKKTTQIYTQWEVEVVRVRITLACTECKQRNYNMTKEKKNHPERLETKKYCKFCQRHTMHKETK
jgi:large subunit ribosomal protein L33